MHDRHQASGLILHLAKDISVQELIAELALRIILLAQLNKFRHLFVAGLECLPGEMVNSFPQCGRALNGASSFSITGSSLLTAGQSCFQVKWIVTQGCL